MKLHAYVLAGDPAWIPQSIASYYSLVDRIVVSYDRTGRSWRGHELSVNESLRRLRQSDPEGKMCFQPGDHVDASRHPMQIETEQRQAALDAAAIGADWVLQLDTDEIVAAPRILRRAISDAHARGAHALEFPARVLYARTPRGRFLENCSRLWQTQANYPGPIAVRAGTTLSFARQAATAPLYRVDVAPWNTDPAHRYDAPVHSVIRADAAILHMSWVRTDAQMAEKARVSGHASERDWPREISAWERRTRQAWPAVAAAPLVRDPANRFKLTKLDRFAKIDP